MTAWLTYLPFRLAAVLFGLFPEPVVRRLGEAAGRLAYRRGSSRNELLARHMRRVMGQDTPDADIAAAVEDMYRWYGRYWAETFWFRPRRADAINQRVERVNFDPVYAAKQAGRGIVFAVAHIGNWEVAGIVAADIGVPVLAVAEDLPNPHITKWFIDVRGKFQIDIVLTTDPKRRSKLLRRLKDGGAIALLTDRDVTGRGIPVEFFGEQTTIPAGPVALADLTGAALIPVAVYFKPGEGHRIIVHDEVDLPTADNRAERVALGAQHMADVMERLIREDPAQWHLFQPNWPSDRDDMEHQP